ncbi:hypothetical protein BS78_06G274700 [Paspalum vaginatum]|nr:hypothetical protein BS78_06G274700 [Paspalum vaginatum]
MAAVRCPWLVLMLLQLVLLLACSGAGAADDENLTHLRFYFHEVRTGAPNETSVLVASLNRTGSTFGDPKVFDNALRAGEDPSSTLIGRARGLGVFASVDNSGGVTTIEFVFSDYGNYSGSTLATLGHFTITSPSRACRSAASLVARACSGSRAGTSPQKSSASRATTSLPLSTRTLPQNSDAQLVRVRTIPTHVYSMFFPSRCMFV